jgi:hypothetical protein
LIGRRLETEMPHARWATTIGVVSGIVQIIGLLRWVFVIPVPASAYVNTSAASAKESIEISFILIHPFGGVLLGEHLGQLFTVIRTVVISYAMLKTQLIPKKAGSLWLYCCRNLPA